MYWISFESSKISKKLLLTRRQESRKLFIKNSMIETSKNSTNINFQKFLKISKKNLFFPNITFEATAMSKSEKIDVVYFRFSKLRRKNSLYVMWLRLHVKRNEGKEKHIKSSPQPTSAHILWASQDEFLIFKKIKWTRRHCRRNNLRNFCLKTGKTSGTRTFFPSKKW